MHKFILRQHRDFGTLINDYFDFLKFSLKPFFNIFIRYNGIAIIALLGASYLLVTGFMGMVRFQSTLYGNTSNEMEHLMYIGLGGFLFLIIFLVVAAMNYSLASSYVISFEKSTTPTIDSKDVWKRISAKIGQIILFIVLFVLLYIAFFIVGMLVSFIPFFGTLAYYLGMFIFLTWMGMSFMAMFYENKKVTEAFGEGWRLLQKNFWKCIGVNVVLWIIIAVILMALYTVPGILIGVYAYQSVESNIAILDSSFAKILFTITLCFFFVVSLFSHALQQFANGILYFTMHEETYNTNTRAKIEQIGAHE